MSKGTLIGGRYRLARPLGQVARGEVWAAVDEGSGGEVALKLFSRAGDKGRRRILREARAAAAVRHPQIAAIREVGETDQGEPFTVMDLLAGESLADLLSRRRRLAPARAAHIARDAARALAAAHAAGVVHRGLHPSNIFLAGAGHDEPRTLLLDFGAHLAPDITHPPSFAYASPEQVSGRRVDRRTDLWSLGAVLFTMITGRSPFDAGTGDLASRILAGPVPSVSHRVRDVDPGLVDLVSRCLQRDPDQRIASAADLAAALDRVLTPGLPAEPPSALEAEPTVPIASVPRGPLSHLDQTIPLRPNDLARAAAAPPRVEEMRPPPPAPEPPPVASRPSPAPPASAQPAPQRPKAPPRAALLAAGLAISAAVALTLSARHRASPARVEAAHVSAMDNDVPPPDKASPSVDKPAPSVDKPAPSVDKPAPSVDIVKPAPPAPAVADAGAKVAPPAAPRPPLPRSPGRPRAPARSPRGLPDL